MRGMRRKWLSVAVAVVCATQGQAASYTRGSMKFDLTSPKKQYHMNEWPDRLDPAYFDTKSRYGWYLKNGLEHMKRGLREASVELLVHAAGLQPFQPYVRRALGHAFFTVGEYKAAVDQFLRMAHLSQNPWRLEIDFNEFYEKDSDFARDLLKLRKEVEAHPEDAELAFLLGLYHYYEEDYVQALGYLEAAVDKSNGNADYSQYLRYCKRESRRK